MSDENSTAKRIKLAFAKLKRDAVAGQAPAIAAVAREAKVSNSLIHNKYPTIAEEIRLFAGRGPKQQLARNAIKVEALKVRAAELRKEVRDGKRENKGLASQNSTLTLLVKRLEGEVHALEAGATPLRPRSQKSGA